ncbi:MAG: hypothetical protein ACO4AU_07700 [bacterium]
MKRYTFDRQNYQIFKVDAEAERPFVHFLWGKFDFKIVLVPTDAETAASLPKKSFERDGSFYVIENLLHLHHNQWYTFDRPTAHGLQLEETRWSCEGQTYYAEFPKDLLSMAARLASEELGVSPLHAAHA